MSSNARQDRDPADPLEPAKSPTPAAQQHRGRDLLAIRFAALAIGALLIAWVIALVLFVWWVVSSLLG